MTEDFTISEMREAVTAFMRSIGPKAEIFVSMNTLVEAKALGLAVYPNGILGNALFRVAADTLRDLLAVAQESWAERSEQHNANLVREMALQIIAITADQGECTDAALRGAKFSADEVRFYGAKACLQATEMASNGPFSIVSMLGANQNESA